MTGYIKFFDVKKRFGIIIPEGVPINDRARHVFFYEDAIEGGAAYAGQAVEYSLLPEYPTPRALTVKLLGKRGYVPINERRKAAYGAD